MLMKRLFLLVSLIFIAAGYSYAQLEVKAGSFKRVDGFVNINTDKMYDDNDKPYAVLKVKTENINDKQRRELLFEGDARTFIECEYKVGEVWVYMSYYASYIKISHPDFSSTEFTFPFDMEPKKGYELTLVNKAFAPAAPAKEQYNYLIVKCDQPNAVISIDGQYAGEGETSQYFKVGETHTWSIECNLYHPESGSANIIKGDPVTIDKTLRPAFGYLNVTTKPENGATVFIDNTRIGETPCKSGKLASGQHKVRVMKELYATTEQTFTVTDGNTIEAAINMAANYVNVTVTTDSQSDIYIDNEKKGKGTWSGRLGASEHFIEAKKASHKTAVKTVMLTLGKDETIVVPDPTPIYGTLNVNSSPMGAKIIIDGKDYGTTPKILDEILIGTHEVRLEKEGMTVITRQITLDETNMALINEKMIAANAQNTQQNATSTAVATSTGTKTQKSDTKHTEFVDDFNDNYISTDLWITSGNRVIEADGIMKLEQNKTDDNVALKTIPLTLSPSNNIVIDRKFKIHENSFKSSYGVHFYSAHVAIILNNNDKNYISVVYFDDDYAKKHGTYITAEINGAKTEQRICDNKFDTWLTEKISVDVNAGKLTYYRDGKQIQTVNINGLSNFKINTFAVKFRPIGWWTGHYQYMDDLRIEGCYSENGGGQYLESISDDFNGNSINTQYWIPSGDVVVGNGNLKISQSKTDKDMSVTTQNISLQEHKTIVVERKFYSHI